MKAKGLPLVYDHRNFRLVLAKQLAAEWEAMGCSLAANITGSPNTRLANSRRPRSHLRGKLLEDDERWASVDGHASFFSKLPELNNKVLAAKVSRKGKLVYPSHRSMKCRYCTDFLKLKKPKSTSWW